MPSAAIVLDGFRCTGKAECVAGTHPDPPLDRWPLLVWVPEHPEHPKQVMTEDGAAAVADIATAACETPDYTVLAERFGTTPDHVAQAVDYAVTAGFLSGKES